MADLDLGNKTKPEQDALVDELIKTLQIKSTGRDNLYTLAFRDSKPERAKRVVQSLVSIFVESGLGKSARTRIRRKIHRRPDSAATRKVGRGGKSRKEFKLRNLELQNADGKVGTERLGDLSTQLAKAKLDLREAENSRDALRRQIVGEDPVLLPVQAVPRPAFRFRISMAASIP